MRALIQRVKQASVSVDDHIIGQIDAGLLVLVGLGKQDTVQSAEKLLKKLLAYRVFTDQNGKMGLSLSQTGGGLLLVSQFTLMADTSKGLRPDFGPALPPDQARALFDSLVQLAQAQHPTVATGQFGADMQVSLINDGPVTFMLTVEE
jgi:D-tyrosyl-tRNA(Tyr) deacylase